MYRRVERTGILTLSWVSRFGLRKDVETRFNFPNIGVWNFSRLCVTWYLYLHSTSWRHLSQRIFFPAMVSRLALKLGQWGWQVTAGGGIGNARKQALGFRDSSLRPQLPFTTNNPRRYCSFDESTISRRTKPWHIWIQIKEPEEAGIWWQKGHSSRWAPVYLGYRGCCGRRRRLGYWSWDWYGRFLFQKLYLWMFTDLHGDLRTMLERRPFYTDWRYVIVRRFSYTNAHGPWTDRRSCHYDTHDRIQRWVGDIQKP